MNLYGFAGGDPVSYSDPFGLWPSWQDIKDAISGEWEEFKIGYQRRIIRTAFKILAAGAPDGPEEETLSDPVNQPTQEVPAPPGSSNNEGKEGDDRLKNPDGSDGPKIKFEFRIPGIPEILNAPIPSWAPIPPKMPTPLPAPTPFPLPLPVLPAE